MKTKLLCKDVFVSYNTSANDPIAERDATTPPYTFDDCSGNTQDLITKITKSARQIRLVSVREVVVDIGHKVEVMTCSKTSRSSTNFDVGENV
ncbi:hypothetical protein MBANPS3_010281 [Mucor bainieri]